MFTYNTTGKEETGAGLMPEGETMLRCSKSEDKVSSKGSDMIKLTFSDSVGRNVYEYIVDNEYAGSKIRKILEAAGIYRGGMQVTSATFRNITLKARIEHEDFNGSRKAKIAFYIKKPVAAQPDPNEEDVPF